MSLRLPRRLTYLWHQRQIAADLSEELEFHRAEKQKELERRGVPNAESASRRALGNSTCAREDARAVWVWRWLDDVTRDVAYGVRGLRRNPGFTSVAVVTLALGIGANAAIFTLMDGVMFKPLGVEAANELILLQRIDEQGPDPQLGIGPKARFSYPAFQRFSIALPPTTSITAMSRVALFHVRAGDNGSARGTNGQLVSGAYFSTLRVTPLRGRLLEESDNRQVDAHPVAVISHFLWQQLGSTSDVVGKPMIVNGASMTIVGVTQNGFRGVWADLPTDFWLPLSMQHVIGYRQNYSISRGLYDSPWLPQDGVSWLTIVARVPAHHQQAFAVATDAVHRNDLVAQAEERKIPLERVAVELERRRLLRTPFEQGLSTLRPQFASPLSLLMGLVGLVLVVACVNVANLLSARGIARTLEIGVRLSLGATRFRLGRQLVVESLVLSALGGTVGVLVGAWFSRGLAALAMVEPLPIDTRVLIFSLGLSALTGGLFAMAPIIGAIRVEPARMTAAASKGAISASGATRMRALMAIQIALTFVVVVGASLFGRSLANVARVDPGFESQQLVALSFNPSASGYEVTQSAALQRRLLDWATAVPGVISASMSSCALAAGCRNSQTVRFDDYTPASDERVQVQVAEVGANYFATTSMDLIEGRGIEARDIATGGSVAVVNASLAQRYFGQRSPLGKRLGRGSSRTFWFEIVGVIRDARINDLMEAPVPTVFVPFPEGAPGQWVLQALVRGNAGAVLRDLEATIKRLEPGLLVERATTIESQLQRNRTQQRLVAYLASGFGGLALVLACVGVYGVMAYGVARRTHEMGIRIALGADPGDLLRGVLTEGTLVAGIGVALGAAAALWTTRYIGPMLYGVSPFAPMPYILVVSLMLTFVIVACVVPARRAAHADPVRALRSE